MTEPWDSIIRKIEKTLTPLRDEGVDSSPPILVDGDVDYRMDVYTRDWEHLLKGLEG